MTNRIICKSKQGKICKRFHKFGAFLSKCCNFLPSPRTSHINLNNHRQCHRLSIFDPNYSQMSRLALSSMPRHNIQKLPIFLMLPYQFSVANLLLPFLGCCPQSICKCDRGLRRKAESVPQRIMQSLRCKGLKALGGILRVVP